MLRLARTAALVCSDREIGGMAERQERAGCDRLEYETHRAALQRHKRQL
jgi:hypothetical protein